MMNTSVKDLKKISTLPDEQGRREGTSRVPQLRELKKELKEEQQLQGKAVIRFCALSY